MGKATKKLGKKVALTVAVFTLLLTACLGIIGYQTYYIGMLNQYQKYTTSVLNLAVAGIDWDKIEQSIIAGVEDEYFATLRAHFDYIKSNTKIDWLYMFEPLNANEKDNQRYICTGNTQKEYEDYAAKGQRPVWLGKMNGTEVPPDIAQKYVDFYKNAKPGEFWYYPNLTEWGYIYTTSVIVSNSSGKSIGVLSVDINMGEILKVMHFFPFVIAFAGFLAAALFILFLIYWLRKSVIRPLGRLESSAAKFVESCHGSNDPESLVFTNPEIHTQDEIENLADALLIMASDLKTYMKNLMLETAEKERIGAELNVATNIQASMLPITFPPFPDRAEFDVYATMNPAKEVGGDFYDFFMVDERHVAIVVADVSGKGVPAALFMVIGKTLIKDHTVPGTDPAEVFMKVNDLLCESNGQGLFITAFEGVLDLVTGEFRYVNAGHEKPYVWHKDSFVEQNISAAFVLAGMEGMKYKSGSIMLEPGDMVFQYTDGVTEATDANNKLYGDARLNAILNKTKNVPGKELLAAVKKDIDNFVGAAPQFDDITMLCLEYKKRMEIK